MGWLGRASEPMYVTGDQNQPRWSVPALTFALMDNLPSGCSRVAPCWKRSISSNADSAEQLQRPYRPSSRKRFVLLTSAVVRKRAFDLNRESIKDTRERYGRNIHGQCVLLARRLIDHEVPFVAVNWHNDGQNFWDTHGNNFQRLERDLIPPSNQALSALLTDLAASGKLDETLVVWAGEFSSEPADQWEHRTRSSSRLLLGTPGGRWGAGWPDLRSQRSAHSTPADCPASPHDLAATVLHALGVPRDAILADACNVRTGCMVGNRSRSSEGDA